MLNLDALTEFLDRLADAAATAIMPHFRTSPDVENKGSATFDPVTVADREAEASMRRLITEAWPDHGIVGEEFGVERPDAEAVWVLDPIDGTRAFITGLPVWGTLIGLTHRRKPVLGMMAQHFTGERFAGNGARSWFTGPGGAVDLTTRACPSIDEAVLFTTSPKLFTGPEQGAYGQIEREVRLARYGCDCYAYCMVAAGHADLVVEAGLQPYDIAGLIPVIEGAGGIVTDWSGGSAADGGRIVASGDRRVHDRALELLSAVPG